MLRNTSAGRLETPLPGARRDYTEGAHRLVGRAASGRGLRDNRWTPCPHGRRGSTFLVGGASVPSAAYPDCSVVPRSAPACTSRPLPGDIRGGTKELVNEVAVEAPPERVLADGFDVDDVRGHRELLGGRPAGLVLHRLDRPRLELAACVLDAAIADPARPRSPHQPTEHGLDEGGPKSGAATCLGRPRVASNRLNIRGEVGAQQRQASASWSRLARPAALQEQ